MRFLYCIYDEERPVLRQPKEKQRETLSKKKRPSVEVSNCVSESDQEQKTVPKDAPLAKEVAKVKMEIIPEVVPQKLEERIAVVVTQNENEHPVISIPSPPPSSESTPELDLLDMIDKNMNEETALAINNNNDTEIFVKPQEAVVERPKTPVTTKALVPTVTTTSSLSVSVSTPLTVSTASATSPSKSKARSPGNGPSILTIASELARKQQEQLERERERELLTARAPKIVPSVNKQNQLLPSARLGTGKSSLEIKLVSSSAATKPSQSTRPDPSKPQTSITLKSNPDKDKTKSSQPRASMETFLSAVPQKHHNLSTFPRLSLPPLNQKAAAKRPNQPYKFHNYEGSLPTKEAKDDGAKKQKLEEKKCPVSPSKNNHKLYHSSTISPFTPVHKPIMHPLSIATPSPKMQRPASLSSASSPSPSPPSTDLRHYSPPQQPKKSPTIEPPLSPVMYNGLLTAAVARHPNHQSLAAALLMRQQIEYQKLYSRPEWAFSQHFMHHSAAAAANTIKRLNEDYMRSLYSFGVGAPANIPTTSTTTPLSSSHGNSK